MVNMILSGGELQWKKQTHATLKKNKILAIHSHLSPIHPTSPVLHQSHLNLVSAQSKVNDIEGNQCDGIQCKPWFYLGDMCKQQVKAQTCWKKHCSKSLGYIAIQLWYSKHVYMCSKIIIYMRSWMLTEDVGLLFKKPFWIIYVE